MAEIRPFRAVRPAADKASAVAALPYDVYTREEAAAFVKDKPLSFLNIDRPETAFPPAHDMYADDVYRHAAETYRAQKARGIFITEEKPCYYVYELKMGGRTQTGIAALSSVDDYLNGVCKKHENTVAAKEQDRILHVDALSAQTGPIFLSYHDVPEIDRITEAVKQEAPLYAFTAEDGIRHRIWRVEDAALVAKLTKAFAGIPCTYIADGHHRAASAVKAALFRREAAENTPENERHADEKTAAAGEACLADGLPAGKHAYDYFLSVLFPDTELVIYDYNRVVLDLNGHTVAEFLKLLGEHFDVVKLQPQKEESKAQQAECMRPKQKGDVGMYLDGTFYRLRLKEADAKARAKDAVSRLDVSVLQDLVLSPLLGIGDPRTDSRIRFLGGIRGLSALVKEADLAAKAGLEKDGGKKGPAAAFAMYPTSMQELFAVADAGRLMPPKSTWFEPKLRSGLLIHDIEKGPHAW